AHVSTGLMANSDSPTSAVHWSRVFCGIAPRTAVPSPGTRSGGSDFRLGNSCSTPEEFDQGTKELRLAGAHCNPSAVGGLVHVVERGTSVDNVCSTLVVPKAGRAGAGDECCKERDAVEYR